MCLYSISLLAFLFYCVVSISANTPSIFQICERSDPKFEACLMAAIENGAKSMQFGLPDFNIPNLGDFKTLTIEAGSGPVRVVQHYSNTTVSGFVGNMIVKQAHFDWPKKLLTFTSFHPIVEQIGYYNFSGEVFSKPVYGKGKYFIKFYNLTATTEIQFREVKKGNDIFFDVAQFSLSYMPKNIRMHFDNLFDGHDDPQAKQLNEHLNEKWQSVFLDVKSKYEAAFAGFYSKALENIVGRIPVKDLFPQ